MPRNFACSPNSWTDEELALKWLVDDFDKHIQEKAGGRLHALFLDGHTSHYTPELLEYALKNGIMILGYSVHCTHTLQSLDVVCFAHMKQTWCEALDIFEVEHSCGINKSDFAGVFGGSFLKAFTLETIKSAFEKTGIIPFNPNVIIMAQLKPSVPHSTAQSLLTFTLPSPVKADLNIDPALYSPQSPALRAQHIQVALCNTSSGAHLASDSQDAGLGELLMLVINHPPKIPDEWMDDPQMLPHVVKNLCARLVNAEAQLLLQNVQVKQLQVQAAVQLEERLNKVSKKGVKGGRHMTDRAIVEVHHQENATLEARWQAMLKTWWGKVAAWEELIKQLTEEKIPKSKQPKQPPKPKKPKLISQMQSRSQNEVGLSGVGVGREDIDDTVDSDEDSDSDSEFGHRQ
ncbi:hypothetical protein M422DRAFT_268294 [Sphaerobolus stellatus SS14]|uniref:DDE-1 domain-containing protein n=1 Tax=Sphaerobolus stellatus (strain SS14) TaxID=990650 RepID=A0A0C9TKF3_SPHS4|nr:hypothetical protein M422DRAFT_268294 [Sphaerobolus stellatus SS14]